MWRTGTRMPPSGSPRPTPCSPTERGGRTTTGTNGEPSAGTSPRAGLAIAQPETGRRHPPRSTSIDPNPPTPSATTAARSLRWGSRWPSMGRICVPSRSQPQQRSLRRVLDGGPPGPRGSKAPPGPGGHHRDLCGTRLSDGPSHHRVRQARRTVRCDPPASDRPDRRGCHPEDLGRFRTSGRLRDVGAGQRPRPRNRSPGPFPLAQSLKDRHAGDWPK